MRHAHQGRPLRQLDKRAVEIEKNSGQTRVERVLRHTFGAFNGGVLLLHLGCSLSLYELARFEMVHHRLGKRLRANGAEQHFAFVVGYPRLFGKGKALKRILRAERLHRDEVLYIGDELRDIEAAKKAGVRVAAVTWGFHTAELLRTGAPDYVVDDAKELVSLVTSSRSAGV